MLEVGLPACYLGLSLFWINVGPGEIALQAIRLPVCLPEPPLRCMARKSASDAQGRFVTCLNGRGEIIFARSIRLPIDA